MQLNPHVDRHPIVHSNLCSNLPLALSMLYSLCIFFYHLVVQLMHIFLSNQEARFLLSSFKSILCSGIEYSHSLRDHDGDDEDT